MPEDEEEIEIKFKNVRQLDNGMYTGEISNVVIMDEQIMDLLRAGLIDDPQEVGKAKDMLSMYFFSKKTDIVVTRDMVDMAFILLSEMAGSSKEEFRRLLGRMSLLALISRYAYLWEDETKLKIPYDVVEGLAKAGPRRIIEMLKEDFGKDLDDVDDMIERNNRLMEKEVGELEEEFKEKLQEIFTYKPDRKHKDENPYIQ